MKFVLIFGPPAVGKMTVGEELSKLTGLKLFHNHVTIELVAQYFDFGTPSFRYLVDLFRKEIFEEMAKSRQKGLIFTFLWALDLPSEKAYVENIMKIFTNSGADTYLVELEADLEERLRRNKTPKRLENKPSKRDLAGSEARLLEDGEKHRLNTKDGELQGENYVKINNTHLHPEEVAKMIVKKFGF